TTAGSRSNNLGLPHSTSRGNSAPGPNQINDPRYHKRKYPGHRIAGKGNLRGPVQSKKKGYPMQKRPGYYGGGPREGNQGGLPWLFPRCGWQCLIASCDQMTT